MNTNNKEALKLLKCALEDLGPTSDFDGALADIEEAISLLQDNEDTEAQPHDGLCSDLDCGLCYTGVSSKVGKAHKPTEVEEEPFKFECRHPDCQPKPSSKVDKLKAIKERLQLMDSPRPEVLYLRDEIVRITNVLSEEEY